MSTEAVNTPIAVAAPVQAAGRLRTALTIVFSLIALACALAAIGLLVLPARDRIARGVTVDGVAIGEMTAQEAEAAMTRAITPIQQRQLILTAGAQARTVTLAELCTLATITDRVHEAMAVGRIGTLPARLAQSYRARATGVRLPSALTVDKDAVRDVVREVAQLVDSKPVDATARWDDTAGRMIVTPSQDGITLDRPAARSLVLQTLRQTALGNMRPLPDALPLPMKATPPRLRAESLGSIDTILGTFTTSFATSTANRARNVETAAQAINHTILGPGEIFSFNNTVGPRSSDNGFVTAPVIIDGQLRPGIGGGVCQVSTTLYNAVLLAGLRIVQRSHHSLPIHYAPPGRDATVAFGAIDFRFRNTSDAPVMIESHAAKRKLTIRVLGKGPAPVVKIERSALSYLPMRTITRKDPTLPAGKRVVVDAGKPGVKVTVTRTIGEGEFAIRETLSTDRYLGEPAIIRVGTGPAAPPAPTPVPVPAPTDSEG